MLTLINVIVKVFFVFFKGIGLTDTKELDGMASKPISKYSVSVQEFDELEGLTDTIFGGEECGKNDLNTLFC